VPVWNVSNVAYSGTAFSSARAWLIWSYAWVAVPPVRFVGLVTQHFAQEGDHELVSGTPAAEGLSANPAMVAARL
jgi:hypothetical protein